VIGHVDLSWLWLMCCVVGVLVVEQAKDFVKVYEGRTAQLAWQSVMLDYDENTLSSTESRESAVGDEVKSVVNDEVRNEEMTRLILRSEVRCEVKCDDYCLLNYCHVISAMVILMST
jgi:hypothetical protein